jgi:hypothetical protein
MSYDFYEGDDATAEFAPLEPPKRRRRLGVILLSVAVVVVLAGCGVIVSLMKGSDDLDRTSATPKSSSKASDVEIISAPTSEVPSPTAAASSARPSKSPSPSRTSKKPVTKPTELAKAPAPQHSTAPGCSPSKGPNQLAKADVKALLVDAAGTAYWGTGTKVEYADIRVPQQLVFAVAEQESGWQSDIKACDGGLGLMQVMPATQNFVNGRFGTSRDRAKPADNAKLGANYLAWLIAVYGDEIAAVCETDPVYDPTKDPLLMRLIISAYNWGTKGVDPVAANCAKPEQTPTAATVPNGQYVQNVTNLLKGSHLGNY